jgi:hypothetical protein
MVLLLHQSRRFSVHRQFHNDHDETMTLLLLFYDSL